MVKPKLKMCAGCDSMQYIYKNIDGKKYCKSCTLKLQPKSSSPVFKINIQRIKPIPKVSAKQKIKNEKKKGLLELDKEFYLKVWNNRFCDKDISGAYVPIIPPRCQCCGRRLGYEPNLMYFHHILEKRNYPQYRHEEWNIAVVCATCHSSYEAYPDAVPKLKLLKEQILSALSTKSDTNAE